MDFVFQGFQTSIPIWVYILLFALIAAGVWWSYKGLETISRANRYLLTGLKSGAFFILLVLLLNPFFRRTHTYEVRPVISVYLDNSASTSIEKGQYTGETAYREAIGALGLTDTSRVRYQFYSVNGSVRRATPGSLAFNGTHTDLYNVIEHIRDRSDDIRASILFSDGIFNRGRNPVFEAGNLRTPVFTVALGDTSRPKDVVLQEVVTNSTGYVNTAHSVEVRVRANGFENASFEVQLRNDTQVLDSSTLQAGSSSSSHSVQFTLKPREEGLQQFEIRIPALQGEWTAENNMQSFSVNVLDAKQHVLSVAFGIHPDVRLVRSILLGDQNIQLSTRTWLGGNRFVEGPFSVAADSLDLLLVHGFPSSGLPPGVMNKLEELLGSVPALVMALPGYDPAALSAGAGVLLPNEVRSPPRYGEIVPAAAVEPTGHPVMELPEVDFGAMPPLEGPLNGLATAPGATALFESRYRGSPTGIPLISVIETDNLRRTEISGYGWYRIHLGPNPSFSRFTTQLFLNVTDWTATRPDNRRLKIAPTQEVYSGREPVVFNAFLTNESGENEAGATIDLTLTGDTIEERYYTLENRGNGRYSLDIGSFPEGVYRYRAVAEKGERTIDRQDGEFSISSTNIEFIDTRRNDRLLQQVAARSGGASVRYDQASALLDSLQERGLMKPEIRTDSIFFYPYRHFIWFVIVVLLLTGEWLLRKFLSLP